MSGSHGDLFHEIGKLVLAAHAGQAIDLAAKSEELAERYGNLGMPAELIAKAIARSLGAISVSMAIVSSRPAMHGQADGPAFERANGHAMNGEGGPARLNGEANGHGADKGFALDGAEAHEELLDAEQVQTRAKAASALFPSGLRLAVLS